MIIFNVKLREKTEQIEEKNLWKCH